VRRILFILLVLLSIALLGAAAGAWVRSHKASDHWWRITGEERDGLWMEKTVGFWWAKGRLILYWNKWGSYRHGAGKVAGPVWRYEKLPVTDPVVHVPGYDGPRFKLGFHLVRNFRGPGSGAAAMPVWPIVALASVMPAWGLLSAGRALVRRRRRKKGWCANCGYDLRASAGRCPECGTQVKTSVSRAVGGNP
jgi:hypothetical protein